jgi:hypothetical protein
MKRNKNQISRIKNILEKKVINKYECGMSRGNQYISRCSMGIPAGDLGVKGASQINLEARVYLPKAKLLIEEHKGRLVFGIDTSSFKLSVPLENITDAIARRLRDPSDSYYDDFSKNVYDQLGGVYGAWNYPGGRGSFCQKLETTKEFHELYTRSEKEIESSNIVLRDKEFPFVSNRNMMPILVFDEETGEGYFINSNGGYGQTYRGNHSVIQLTRVAPSDFSYLVIATCLLDLNQSGKYTIDLR